MLVKGPTGGFVWFIYPYSSGFPLLHWGITFRFISFISLTLRQSYDSTLFYFIDTEAIVWFSFILLYWHWGDRMIQLYFTSLTLRQSYDSALFYFTDTEAIVWFSFILLHWHWGNCMIQFCFYFTDTEAIVWFRFILLHFVWLPQCQWHKIILKDVGRIYFYQTTTKIKNCKPLAYFLMYTSHMWSYEDLWWIIQLYSCCYISQFSLASQFSGSTAIWTVSRVRFYPRNLPTWHGLIESPPDLAGSKPNLVTLYATKSSKRPQYSWNVCKNLPTLINFSNPLEKIRE